MASMGGFATIYIYIYIYMYIYIYIYAGRVVAQNRVKVTVSYFKIDAIPRANFRICSIRVRK